MSQALVGRIAAPADLAALTAVLRAAGGRGAPLHVRGAGLWWPDPPPRSDVVSLASLDVVSDFNPTDLVVTAGAGTPLDALSARLAAKGAFLAFDPPGPPSRTLGGSLACGAAGPLAAHYGSARDQVLGLVVVAGNGTVVRLGGRVVKNVAGFDLAKLVIGGHGSFGVIAEAHLRLRALPRADRTAIWTGTAEWAQVASRAALAAGAMPAALEVLSPELAAALGWGGGGGDAWVLATRALGAPSAVDEELDVVAQAVGRRCASQADGDAPWVEWRRTVGNWPTVLRIGADPAWWTDAIALARRLVAGGALLGASVTVPRGTVRVGAQRLDLAEVRRLRADAAARNWPVTLERADAATRAAVGIWGSLPPAADRLARSLEALFNPAGSLAAPLLT